MRKAKKRKNSSRTRVSSRKSNEITCDSNFQWTRKDFLGMDDLSAEEIVYLMDRAEKFVPASKDHNLKHDIMQNQITALMFFENSTRTRMSFELAANRLGSDTILFTAQGSSISKGETTLDTVRNIEAMGVNVFAMRHHQSGAAHVIARQVDSSIINAGDGAHEHPTQALLDIFTIRQELGGFVDKKVAIVGDIAHSRVARSNILALRKLGAEVIVVGPPTLVPGAIRDMGCQVCHNLDDVLDQVDVINMLRIQFERFGGGLFPSVREYHHMYGLTAERLNQCKPDVLIQHPGPINRGVEITTEVADSANNCILSQVSNGLATRMAVLEAVFNVQQKMR